MIEIRRLFVTGIAMFSVSTGALAVWPNLYILIAPMLLGAGFASLAIACAWIEGRP